MFEFIESVKSIIPKITYLQGWNPTGEYEGIKALCYEGIDNTKIFAYLGRPKTTEKTPAVLLIHGGGGHPFLPWVKLWTDKGYTALAVETTGHFPLCVNAGSYDGDNINWKYGTYGEFCEEGIKNAPDNDGMYKSTEPDIKNMWMTHALCTCILGKNILASDSMVYADKIGVTGISWGGVIASLLIGYDTDFAFAVPVYGSGYLSEARSWMGENFNAPKTKELWSAEELFYRVKTPVMWLCWNSDNCFSINSNCKSYMDTVKNNAKTRISIKNEMYHSHVHGWLPEETYAFADSIIYGGELARFLTQPSFESPVCEVGITGNHTAKLYYLTEPMGYIKESRNALLTTYPTFTWKTMPLQIENGKIKIDLPSDAQSFYIELQSEYKGRNIVICSTYVEKTLEKCR